MIRIRRRNERRRRDDFLFAAGFLDHKMSRPISVWSHFAFLSENISVFLFSKTSYVLSELFLRSETNDLDLNYLSNITRFVFGSLHRFPEGSSRPKSAAPKRLVSAYQKTTQTLGRDNTVKYCITVLDRPKTSKRVKLTHLNFQYRFS